MYNKTFLNEKSNFGLIKPFAMKHEILLDKFAWCCCIQWCLWQIDQYHHFILEHHYHCKMSWSVILQDCYLTNKLIYPARSANLAISAIGCNGQLCWKILQNTKMRNRRTPEMSLALSLHNTFYYTAPSILSKFSKFKVYRNVKVSLL